MSKNTERKTFLTWVEYIFFYIFLIAFLIAGSASIAGMYSDGFENTVISFKHKIAESLIDNDFEIVMKKEAVGVKGNKPAFRPKTAEDRERENLEVHYFMEGAKTEKEKAIACMNFYIENRFSDMREDLEAIYNFPYKCEYIMSGTEQFVEEKLLSYERTFRAYFENEAFVDEVLSGFMLDLNSVNAHIGILINEKDYEEVRKAFGHYAMSSYAYIRAYEEVERRYKSVGTKSLNPDSIEKRAKKLMKKIIKVYD